MFDKTCQGARVGDVCMSLIYTCGFCGASPFHYLTELERHAGKASWNPQKWMPRHYRLAPDSAVTSPDAVCRSRSTPALPRLPRRRRP